MLSFGTSLQVIPPGMEFHHIVPQDGDMEGETEGNEEHPASPDPHIWSEVQIIPFVFTLMCPRQF
jgi:sucrose-phosphate synthase